MKAINPNPDYYDQLAEIGRLSEDIIQKAMKGAKGEYSKLPTAHDLNPWDSTRSYGDTYRSSEHEGTYGLDYDVLHQMSRVPIISAILQTRINQVAEFCTPQIDPYTAGFKISLRDDGEEPTDAQRKQINELTRWMETCGDGYKYGGAFDFESFIRMIVRDSLMYDQCTFEIMRTRGGKVAGFVPVDASTIRRASVSKEEIKEGRREWDKSAFIQIINGHKTAEWDADSLAFAIRRPRSWIYARGYGYPELEELVRTVTYLVNAETYNASNFVNGIHVNSILAVKSKMSPQLFRAFRRDFYAMLSGAHQAKRTPILQLDPDANEEVSSVSMSSSAEEMGYSNWMGYLTKLSCAIYQIDPAELGFVFGAENVTATLSQGGSEGRIIQSKDKGLRPLLRSVQGWINRWVIHPIAPELKFTFEGLTSETAEAKLKSDIDKVSHYMTINEIRAENGLEALESGGDIVLSQTYVTGLSMEQEEGAEGEDFEEGEEGDDFDELEEGEGDDFEAEDEEDEGDDIEKAQKIKVTFNF